MRKVAPSLIVKGFLFSPSREPGLLRSMMMSERPPTSRPRERMMHLRGSLGSERLLPEPMPSDSFHFRRDSSFWSAGWVSQPCCEEGEVVIGGYGQRRSPVGTTVVYESEMLLLFALDMTYLAADTPPKSSFRPP